MAHSLRLAGHHGGKVRQPECEPAGHITSTVGTIEAKAGAQHFLLFIQSGTPVHRLVPPTFRHSLTNIPRDLFPW